MKFSTPTFPVIYLIFFRLKKMRRWAKQKVTSYNFVLNQYKSFKRPSSRDSGCFITNLKLLVLSTLIDFVFTVLHTLLVSFLLHLKYRLITLYYLLCMVWKCFDYASFNEYCFWLFLIDERCDEFLIMQHRQSRLNTAL